MRVISHRVKKILIDDPRMKGCEYKRCGKEPTWHHVFQYAGSQIDEAFNISPACPEHHAQATPHNNKYKREVQEYFEWKALQRMTSADIYKYSKPMDHRWTTLAHYLAIKAKEYNWV